MQFINACLFCEHGGGRRSCPITGKEIAQIAGVSRSTVSRVVNEYGNVPETTRRKVLQAVEKYGYVPHAQARMLAGAVNPVVGLFMVDRKSSTAGRKVSLSGYFSSFLSGTIDHAGGFGIHILACTVTDAEDYEGVRRMFMDKTVAGGIFIGEQDEAELGELARLGCKLVAVDGRPEVAGAITVNADNFGGAYAMTRRLLELGHRRIAHIAGPRNQLSGAERLRGYRQALADAGLPFAPGLVEAGDFMRAGGYGATRALLARARPSAVFFGNDSMALGGMEAIAEAGLRIPEDISAAGFDDIELAEHLYPALTTVRLPFWEMSALAVRSLSDLIHGKLAPGCTAQYRLPVQVVERASCAPPGERAET